MRVLFFNFKVSVNGLLHTCYLDSGLNDTRVLLLPLLLLLLLLLLLQSALQPLWVLVFSTIVEYSQQEGFYGVPLPAACQTPNLEDQ